MAHGVDRSGAASGSGASDDPITEAIIDAKGDLIAGSGADTPVRVAVGTNEKRLVADSAQAAGLGWVADTTNYAVAAKGDLLAGTAADTVAPVTIGAAGDILTPAAGAASGLAWLRFPAPGTVLINGKITRSVAGGVLTIAVKTLADADPSTSSPVQVLMPTATSNVLDGGYAIRSITSALSMTVSSGSKLGHVDAVASPVYVYFLDNAGTIELAVSNTFFGGTSVQSTTAEGGAGAADSGTVLYSTTLRSNVVVACLLRWKSTQTTAGTWAATTGEVQLFPFPHKAPTITALTSGSGTYSTPWDAITLVVRLAGAGSGGMSITGNRGAAGGNTTFGALTGSGGSAGSGNIIASGGGGAASGGNVANFVGSPGQSCDGGAVTGAGGNGGASVFSGAGRGGDTQVNSQGGDAAANSGSGGGGGANTGGGTGAAGGSSGGYVEHIYTTLAATYSYGVGAGGAGGTGGAGQGGGAGAAGIILVIECYV